MMPEGLEKDLNPQDLGQRDRLSARLGAPRKTFMANNPQLVKPTTDGTLQLYPTTAKSTARRS